MKTSEMAAHIEMRNPKLHLGATVPFLPMPPGAMGSRAMVGWIGFNLIRIAEMLPETGALKLFWRRSDCSFSVQNFNLFPRPESGWEMVEFDGYGELENWKEFVK